MEHPILLCFGFGYVAKALAIALPSWSVFGTTRQSLTTPNLIDFHDEQRIRAVAEKANAILISIPPEEGEDPVLRHYKELLRSLPQHPWIGYLSATSVYGDHQGNWVDETTIPCPTTQRGKERLKAEQAWTSLEPYQRITIFRLAGIYGPHRNIVTQLLAGTARRIDAPGHLFSRIHVDDIVQILIKSMTMPKGHLYNVADDRPAATREVIEYTCDLLNLPYTKLEPLNLQTLSPMAQSFYRDNKRVCNKRMKEDLGIVLRFPTYQEGIQSLVHAIKES